MAHRREPQGVSLAGGMMIRVKGLGGSRSHSHVAAALFDMTRRPQRARRRDWAQSDRLKRVEPMAATIGPTTTSTPPPRPSKEEIMETPHFTSSTTLLGMPTSHYAWRSRAEPGP